MLSRPTPRYAIIAIVLLWVIWALWPTLQFSTLSAEDKELRHTEGTLERLEERTIRLGLDLQGGIHLVLEVDIPTLVRNLAENPDDRLEQILSRTTAEMQASGDDFFDVFERQVAASNLRLIRYFSNYGTKVPDIIAALREEAEDAVNRAREIIANRVDQYGVSEPTIQKAGRRRIIIELAGIQDPAQARELIQSTALLEFYLLHDTTMARDVMLDIDEALKTAGLAGRLEPEDTTTAAIAPTDTTTQPTGLETVLGAEPDTAEEELDILTIADETLEERPFSGYVNAFGDNFVVPARYQYAVESLLERPEVQAAIPEDGRFLWSNRTDPLPRSGLDEDFYTLYYVYHDPGLTGGVITEAQAAIGALGSRAANQPVVNLNMNSEGARIWARLTGANVGRRLAIVLDKRVYLAPEIISKIPDGRTVIEGMDNMEEAKLTAIVLRAGSLPAPVSIIEERTVGPSLGQDSIQMGIRAMLIGGGLVIVFMLIYYRFAGLVATLALLVNLVVVLAALASLRATLTLPGIAGLILTVGMAVDANVLIFERIREELDRGKTIRPAIEAGYSRATITIIDANVTTLIAALVMFQFGTGPIKGFAVTLMFGIVASMFTAIFMTRTIFMSVTQNPKVQTLSI
jgi:SecD/SecF fusion protein